MVSYYLHPYSKRFLMVLILDASSEMGAHGRNNLCYLISLRHWIRSRKVTNPIFFQKRPIFFHACVSFSKLSSDINTMGFLLVFYKLMRYFPGWSTHFTMVLISDGSSEHGRTCDSKSGISICWR